MKFLQVTIGCSWNSHHHLSIINYYNSYHLAHFRLFTNLHHNFNMLSRIALTVLAAHLVSARIINVRQLAQQLQPLKPALPMLLS
jgi:hypothetical protein